MNINNIKDCYGCGVCALVCPEKIIKIELNKDGFYVPILFNNTVCTQCGQCISVCAFIDDKLFSSNTEEPDSYAAWSNDNQTRTKCSSGGIGFEIGKQLIKQGYRGCGTRYNPDLNRSEHFLADTAKEFIQSIGSKYIQSYTLMGFSHFNRKDKFFVTGTPCQIDSLRRYIQKKKIENNFVLMDFFCHGVPSMNLWKKYTEMVEKETGKITRASWRNKQSSWNDKWLMDFDGENNGEKINWHNSYSLLIKGQKNSNYFSMLSKGDIFYKMFLDDVCLGRACYDKCKYKMDKSSADIRIGDLWGSKYKENDEGVSALLVYTDKGKDVISRLENCSIIKENILVVTEGQMKFSPKKTKIRKYIINGLSTTISIRYIYKFYQFYLFSAWVFNKSLRVAHLK